VILFLLYIHVYTKHRHSIDFFIRPLSDTVECAELTSRDESTLVARAFVPGHITGVFRIYDDSADPLLRGSTGAGFCVKIGTITTVRVKDHSTLKVSTRYNGTRIDAQVTSTVVRLLAEECGRTIRVDVDHESSLPSGVGFGASGAGALGTAIALGHILDEDLAFSTIASFAHEAEVLNHTGLGDVIAQTKGGTEMRVRAGAPHIGALIGFPYDEDVTVVLAGAPGLQTREVLTDPESRRRINEIGTVLVDRLEQNPSFDTFIECSREFSDAIDLKTPRVRKALGELENNGLVQSSMVMLGDSVFCFCNSTQVEDTRSILSKYWAQPEIFVTGIEERGGRLMT